MHPHDGLAQPARGFAFATIAVAVFLAVLDGAVANIALPPIAEELGLPAAEAIWVVNAYQLAVTVSLLPLASLGEIVGYRRVYLCGLALFTAASLACALSSSLGTLVAARVAQGFGAAGIMSINMALVRFIFPRARLGRAVGNVAMVVAVSAAAGPTIAGAILSVAPWQALFLVNLPIGVVALLVGWRTLPQTPRANRAFDWRSALLSAATFGLVIGGVNAFGHAEGSVLAFGQIAAGVAVGIVFVRSQLRLRTPLLPVDLLQRPVFALSATTSVCSFAAQGIAFVSLPFFLHDALGRSAAETGLLMTPWPLATACAAFVSGRVGEHVHAGRLAALGLCLFAGGLLALALLPAAPSNADIVWRLVLAGFGFGIFQTPNNKVLITSAPPERAGGASGIQSSARLVGQSLGVALLAMIFGLFPEHRIGVALGLATLIAAAGIGPSALRRLDEAPPAPSALPAGGAPPRR